MSNQNLKVGQRVEITGKGLKGNVAFIGTTSFAPGKWVGVVLDTPGGKNNGTLQNKQYFQCEENHGMFVRHSQLTILDDSGQPMESSGGSPSSSTTPTGRTSSVSRKSSLTTSTQARKTDQMRLPVPGIKVEPKDEGLSVTPLKETPPETTKRASFVETGFVENLKPQFTPGQVLSPSISSLSFQVEEKTSSAEAAQLKSENKDLNEKLETLKVKRAQDKEKLKEFDKVRLQLEQMVEFKSRIMDSQAQLQKDLQRARQETREAIEAKERHADEMSDLAETVEMATLDKEMAEEKAEYLQQELDQAKEKLEMALMDLELLRAEMNTENNDQTEKSSTTTLEMKQLMQQNAKLKETLVRLRDLSAHEKHESSKMQKELEMRRSEIQELSRTKEKLSTRVEELEQQIAELQEQVDAALGAEEMVEALTSKNLNLEEKVNELEETVSDLEALADMNEQLQEGTKEMEMELREELDMAMMAKREAQHEVEALHETLADRDMTINKFRELVQRLQEQIHQLQTSVEREASKPMASVTEMMDFKKMIADSKAHTKAIDLELRRIDVQQANQHVHFLTSFMPESFLARGSDNDAILLLLLVPRLLCKTEILIKKSRDIFPTLTAVIDSNLVLQGHQVAQYSFRSRLSFWLSYMQTVLQQLNSSVLTCTPDVLLRIGLLYLDLAAQEKTIDSLLELLRKDQLDENIPLEGLEKCVNSLQGMLTTYLPDFVPEPSLLLKECCRALQAATDGLFADSSAIFAILGAKDSKMGQLLKDISTVSDLLRQQLKQTRRRLPNEGYVVSPKVAAHADPVQQCLKLTSKILLALHETAKNTISLCSASEGAELNSDKALEVFTSAVDRIFDAEDKGAVECIKAAIETLKYRVNSLSVAAQETEFDLEPKKETKTTPPIVLRAQVVKKELEETKILKQKLETRETDIKEMKKAMKLKQEELSEMVIRKDLAESKLGNVHKDYALNLEKLQRKYDDSQMLLKRKEKEFEETMDHLQADIDSLESERGELKEKMKSISKKALIEGMARSNAAGASLATTPSSTGPSLPISVTDSPLLVQEIKSLREALKESQRQAQALRAHQARNILSELPVINVIKKPTEIEPSNLTELSKKASKLHKELSDFYLSARVVDLSNRRAGEKPLLEKTSPAYQLVERKNKENQLIQDFDTLTSAVQEEMLKRKSGAKAESFFSTFPSVEMAKAMKEKDTVLVGRVNVGGTENATKIPLVVDLEALKMIHNSVAPYAVGRA
ncbi:dynactin subunit 1 isoform X2 [Neocloeon triangulifer]|uniref:dynactin subunit 1 isoform X2 n=1 Tax=Neocloeon triangulifer TaxID=2078957 RepID=UPI00286F812F|nr:dynactin subunit 1 isoform X2 [Neocloeon triangulifer]